MKNLTTLFSLPLKRILILLSLYTVSSSAEDAHQAAVAKTLPKATGSLLADCKEIAKFVEIQKSTNALCSAGLEKQFSSPEEMERYLATNSLTSLGDNSQMVSQCLKPFNLSPSQRFAAIADYYYSMNRLKNAALSTMESLASIDLLLGKKPLSDGRDYNIRELPESGTWFQSIQSGCNKPELAKGTFEEMVTQTDLALSILPNLLAHKSTYCRSEQTRNKCLEVAKQIEGVYSLAPWMKEQPLLGESQPERIHSQRPAETLLKLYLQNTRSALSDRLHRFQATSECYNGSPETNSGSIAKAFRNLSCNLKKKKSLEETPDPNFSALASEARGTDDLEKRKKANVVISQMASANCRQEIHQLDRDHDQLLLSTGANMALGIASAGTSLYWQGAKAAAVVGEVAQASRAARLAKNALVTMDLAWAGAGAVEAASACQGVFQKYLKQLPKADAFAQSAPACSELKEAADYTAVSQTGSCLMGAAMAALNFIPLASFAAFSTATRQKAFLKANLLKKEFNGVKFEEAEASVLSHLIAIEKMDLQKAQGFVANAVKGLNDTQRSQAVKILSQLKGKHLQEMPETLNNVLHSMIKFHGSDLDPQLAAKLMNEWDEGLGQLGKTLDRAAELRAKPEYAHKNSDVALETALKEAGVSDLAMRQKMLACAKMMCGVSTRSR